MPRSEGRWETNPWSVRLLIMLSTWRMGPLYRVWSAILGVDLPSKWPDGLVLPHPYAVVIHGATRIGRGCVIYQGVTLGSDGSSGAAPILGDNVVVYAGAVVLGGVQIGDSAVVGANSVVRTSVPPGAVVAGAPARILRRA